MKEGALLRDGLILYILYQIRAHASLVYNHCSSALFFRRYDLLRATPLFMWKRFLYLESRIVCIIDTPLSLASPSPLHLPLLLTF